MHERVSNSLLQSAKRIDVTLGSNRMSELEALKNAVAVSQHHDAITGTAKQAVDSDYNLRLG